MKKRIISLLVVVCMICIYLTACGDKLDVKKEIVGKRWEMRELIPDELNEMLEAYLFEPEEIAYADSEDFAFYRVFTFKEDNTVTLAYDTEKIHETMYNGFDHFLGILYENKENLVDIYGQDMIDECKTEEEFKNFMAYYIGEMDTSEELLTYFADNVVDYYFSENEYTSNSGTYSVKGTKVQVELDQDQNDELTYNADKKELTSTNGEVFTIVAQ